MNWPEDFINKIICGDCLNKLPKIPKESIDLIYLDILYSDKDFVWLKDCIRILKQTGSIYIQCDYRNVAQLKLEMDKWLIFRNWIIWCYKSIPQNNEFYQRKHDDILFYTKSDEYVWNHPKTSTSVRHILAWDKYADKDGRVKTEVIRKVSKSQSMQTRTGSRVYHTNERDWWIDIPAVGRGNCKETIYNKVEWQKPLDLIKRILNASSNEGDLVLDFFLGSGTTAVACKQLGRRFIGIEINPKYCKIAQNRLK